MKIIKIGQKIKNKFKQKKFKTQDAKETSEKKPNLKTDLGMVFFISLGYIFILLIGLFAGFLAGFFWGFLKGFF